MSGHPFFGRSPIEWSLQSPCALGFQTPVLVLKFFMSYPFLVSGSQTCEPGWWFGTVFIFPYIGNSNPNWLIFFRGVETTNQKPCFSTAIKRGLLEDPPAVRQVYQQTSMATAGIFQPAMFDSRVAEMEKTSPRLNMFPYPCCRPSCSFWSSFSNSSSKPSPVMAAPKM